MPDIEIVKLKIRRGTESQRQSVILEQGELGYTIDTKRVWVGDGVLSGGNIVGNIAHTPLDVVNKTGLTNAVKGDIVSEKGFLYQLSGTDFAKTSAWGFIGTRVDNDIIEYNANSQITVKSLSGSFATNSGLIDDGSGTRINVDEETLYVTDTNTLSVLSIDQRHISSLSFGNGLIGGDGAEITLDVDPTQFGFSSSTLTLTAIENGIVNVASLSADSIGDGLQIDGDKLEAVLQGVDSSSIINTGGVISLPTIGGGFTLFEDIEYDSYGRVTSSSSSIIQSLSVDPSITGNADALLNLEDWYRGFYDEPLGSNTTTVYAISTNVDTGTNATITLSSAGFVILSNDLVIPAFRYN